jgi:hypothetical protein
MTLFIKIKVEVEDQDRRKAFRLLFANIVHHKIFWMSDPSRSKMRTIGHKSQNLSQDEGFHHFDPPCCPRRSR